MKKQVIGYVISHTGKKGGPWESKGFPIGEPTNDAANRMVYDRDWVSDDIENVQAIWPNAKVLTLVRGNSLRQRVWELENERALFLGKENVFRERIQELENDRVALENSMRQRVNSVLLNLYRNGNDSIAWQQELESECVHLSQELDSARLSLKILGMGTPTEVQYATTSARGLGCHVSTLSPIPPAGEGWSMVGCTSQGDRLFWFWQKG